ncbi:MAG TPA: hydrogenase maturation nickel metallochaperone HypA [Caldilineae bacterium]|nr:hydrogenase maturation nickel metallochaperone HypA [Caldilineae bacterium]
MHELPVTESILEIVQRHAAAAGVTRVVRIRLVVGELTGFVPDSIQFYFDALSEGTIAEGALLEIERQPGRIRCRACGRIYEPLDGQIWICPDCGGLGGEIVAGKEMYIESIEITEGDHGDQS